jgi:murein DD-endopeptidase MepM/ murein hydrolase activator NlpD
MSRVVEFLGWRRPLQFAALVLVSVSCAGCSGDVSTRLSQNPFSNPFSSQAEATGAVAAPAIERHEPPQYSRPQTQAQYPAPISTPQSYPAANSVSGGAHGPASYSPPVRPIETTSAVAAAHGAGQGGTTIIVGTSDTLEILARRYNVSPAAILEANGYRGPRTLSPGQQLVIPRATTAAAPNAAGKPVSGVVTAPSVHVVNPGDTLAGIARRHHLSVVQLAKANNLNPAAKLRLGTKLMIPAGRAVAAAEPAAGATSQSAAPLASSGTKLANASIPQQSVRLAQATTKPEEAAVEAQVRTTEASGALPTFRWPARGKVITGYGTLMNGKANEGINLAVPEGTPVKAAEDGVVTYSGSELKRYGNLVLVRHSNGYVTAYAHASELLVKRGDTIKRGQIIAKSGQSGEVGSPQLHFEIRKGSSPVDPVQFLNGA